MSTVAGEAAKWFWHKSSQETMLLRDRANHPLEKGIPVGCRQSIGISPVNLELAVRVFVIIRIWIPPKLLHEPEQRGHHVEISVERAKVIARFDETIEVVPGNVRTLGIFLEEHELRFDPDVDDVTLLSSQLKLVHQHRAGTQWPRLAFNVQISSNPGCVLAPRQNSQRAEVGNTADI